MPDVKRLEIKIASMAADAEGNRLAPEEQPTQIITHIDAPVSLNQQPIAGAAFQSRIVDETQTAAELAQNLSTKCDTCVHFKQNPDDMAKLISHYEFSANPLHRDAVREMRMAAALALGEGEDTIDEELLLQMGVCEAFTEINRDVTLVHPLGGCPTEHEGQPFTPLYKPRDRKAAREGAAIYDRVMRNAQGRE